ncbi:hypothetical protein NJLHNGOC_07925 [Novacetimonas cocois]|uniref:Uncharacterized protein n=2 Tax=Novacetimonas cocois TaxID=1747507 RepID=A0A365YXU6_9PROT|nr:hypothetical protein NJLHNGOC_07925 [Novacetimonas cocois]
MGRGKDPDRHSLRGRSRMRHPAMLETYPVRNMSVLTVRCAPVDDPADGPTTGRPVRPSLIQAVFPRQSVEDYMEAPAGNLTTIFIAQGAPIGWYFSCIGSLLTQNKQYGQIFSNNVWGFHMNKYSGF